MLVGPKLTNFESIPISMFNSKQHNLYFEIDPPLNTLYETGLFSFITQLLKIKPRIY